MANELVKEIEDLQSYINGSLGYAREHDTVPTVGVDTAHKLLTTLQRAREALRWIPVSERLPEKNGAYEVWVRTDSLRGGYTDTVYFLDGTWPTDLEIQAWRPQIPYTPEEK